MSDSYPPFDPSDIHLVASDMDGTLLNSHHTLSPRTTHLLSLFLAQTQLPFVIATGRAPWAAKNLPIPAGSLAIHTGGCLLVKYLPRPKDESEPWYEILYEATLEAEAVCWYIDHACRTNRSLVIYSGDLIWAASTHMPMIHALEAYGEPKTSFWQNGQDVGKEAWRGAEDLEALKAAVRAGKLKVNKFIYLIPPPTRDALEQELLQHEAMPAGSRAIASQPENLEILPLGTDKLSTLHKVCSMYGTDISNALTFGDANNDLEMVGEAGYGVAVANANEGLKAVAKWVSGRGNDEDAVAEVLNGLWKLDEKLAN
ncbi:hypothetical protein YB2330_005505 [Saitoella coloradoensis]